LKKTKDINRHIAQRTCLGCRQVIPKGELIRLVRTVDKRVEVDPNGRQTGRGAYLCRKPECWDSVLKSNRIDYSLRTTLTLENREQLRSQGRNLLGGTNIDQ